MIRINLKSSFSKIALVVVAISILSVGFTSPASAATVDTDLAITGTVVPSDGQTNDITNNDLMTVTVTVTNNGPDDLVANNYSLVVSHGSPDLGNAKANGSPAYSIVSTESGVSCPGTVFNGVTAYCELGSTNLTSGDSLTFSYQYLFQRCDQSLTVGQSYAASEDGFDPSVSVLPNAQVSSGGYEDVTTTDLINDTNSSNSSLIGLDFNFRYTGCSFDTDTDNPSEIDILKQAANTPDAGSGETIAFISGALVVLFTILAVRYYTKKKKRSEISTK